MGLGLSATVLGSGVLAGFWLGSGWVLVLGSGWVLAGFWLGYGVLGCSGWVLAGFWFWVLAGFWFWGSGVLGFWGAGLQGYTMRGLAWLAFFRVLNKKPGKTRQHFFTRG